MINPPDGALPGAPPSAAENMPINPSAPLPINVPVDEAEQKEIVKICNTFKTSVKQNARDKKRIMRDAYAYSKSKFVGNDLLPLPQGEGTDRDMQSNRPQIFIPKTRELVKTLYSNLKLTLFPNDEDYFRVRAKTEEGAAIEEQLTDGLKYIWKDALITEKIGGYLLNMISMSNAACLPTIKDEVIYEWQINALTGQYEATQIDVPPLPDIEILDPLHFYVDPTTKDPERTKWGYFGKKKKQEIKDSALYFNKDKKLDDLSTKLVQEDSTDETRTKEYTDLSQQFNDTEDNVWYDLYYFPYLKTSKKEYRNMLVGVAGQQLLVRFHPNLFPRGMNPVVFTTWMDDPQSPYGIGPVEDVMELQKLINMIYNHTTETLARIGNRFIVPEGTDLNGLWGVAGGVLVSDQPEKVRPITGDYTEPGQLLNFAGTLAAELQQVGGAQNPFQGASNIDFKKTATELQILQENSISIVREVIEHISVMGVQRILERLMYLCADLYKEPITIRTQDPNTGQPIFREVDFSVLRSGQFTIELVNVNPSQSKQAQVQTLTELIQMLIGNPQAIQVLEPILLKVAQLEGLRDGPELIQEIKQRIIQNAAPPPGIPNPQAGIPAPEQPGMGESSPPPPVGQ